MTPSQRDKLAEAHRLLKVAADMVADVQVEVAIAFSVLTAGSNSTLDHEADALAEVLCEINDAAAELDEVIQ